jgi:polyisoprenoid-binding protein YceI
MTTANAVTGQTPQTTLPLSPGTWAVDTNHSGINFKIRHLGLSNVRGRFDRFQAAITVGETLDDVKVEATVDMDSVDTNNADRDAHLRGTDFFSTEAHPEMTFKSKGIKQSGSSDYVMEGSLTINGITKDVSWDVEFAGVEVFPGDGSTHAGFSASTEINRDDFGVDFNMPLGMDKMALGQKVKIELDLQFIAPKATEAS